MTKEEKIIGWVVREPVIGHYLSFFRNKPVKIESNKWVDKEGNSGAALGDYKNIIFDDIKTETGPVKVELTLKLV